MSQITTKSIGNSGEDLATQVLTAAGYAIVERNARIGRVEVDILAQHHNRLVFVEVKTRSEESADIDWRYGIDPKKIARIARAAHNYVVTRNLPYEVQIDAILITNRPDGTTSTDHIPDITPPPLRRYR